MSLLEKEGYENVINQSNNTFSGDTVAGLTKLKTIFYVYQKTLSGNKVDLDNLIDKLRLTEKSTAPDVLILITGFSVSGSVKKSLEQNIGTKFQVLERDSLSKFIDQHFPNFWMYENFDLVNYEKFFLENMAEKSALLNIQGLEKKAKKLIDIYIKPRVYEIKSDLESNSTQFIRVSEADIVKRTKSCVVEGDTGSGKSTLLKEIGRLQILEQEELKTLPIFISPMLLYSSNFDIQKAATKLLNNRVPGSWEQILDSYKLLFLIDNIDEFAEDQQKKVVDDLNWLCEKYNVRFILSTRSIKSGKASSYCKDVLYFQIRKFNDSQIKEFASRFFEDKMLADNLLEALEDYRILERLPLTPLSLSLIALVFERENYEIPATISDIYDNFNQLILGKLTATKKFEIINFNFRERILSIYAFEILRNNNGRPFTKDNFIDYFKKYFEDKSSSIASEVIEDFLIYFINFSGILKIEEEKYINFSHKSFLEYYASLEVFKHQRDLQDLLVQNFLDLNWQNVAIFFAGQSKDMPAFLKKILDRVGQASIIDEHSNAILGLGYLLQALYQTDNKLREEAVLLALDQSLILHEWYKKIVSTGELIMFKNMQLPAVSIFNMYFFYLNFLSSTLAEPLNLAFERLFEKYKITNDTTIGYQLLTIAAIFHSRRINDSSYLQKLLDESNLLKDPYLVTVAEFALYFNSSSDHKEMRTQLHKTYSKMSKVTKDLVKLPAGRLRFSNLDLIESNKKVTLVTEGTTDAEIIEHAHYVLTKGKTPYWKIKPSGAGKGGGAKEVKFILDKAKPLIEDNDILIGIFDHDTEGVNQFDGLQYEFYKDYKRVKKMKDASIYGIKLPVPTFREKYVEQEREHLYLAIEHYFDDSILEEKEITKESGIPGLFKIKDSSSAKNKLVSFIKTKKDPEFFRHFIPLFETLDDISGSPKVDYHEFI
jgi:energy-coupling factor transporter ATP-binding protein EcfA2